MIEDHFGILYRGFISVISNMFNKKPEDKKDPWTVVYKNFLHFGYFGVLVCVLMTTLWVLQPEQFLKEMNVKSLGLIQFVILPIASVTFLFVIAHLFKVRHGYAIPAATVWLVLAAVSMLSGGINVFALVIIGYFAYIIYRAHKSKSQILPVHDVPMNQSGDQTSTPTV